jgi:hypothetical protein
MGHDDESSLVAIITINGNQWQSPHLRGEMTKLINGNQWQSMAIPSPSRRDDEAHQWQSMAINGNPLTFEAR